MRSPILYGLLCLSFSVNAQAPFQIKKGVLDLREVNMKDTAIFLQGQVYFHWNEFKTPDDLNTFSAVDDQFIAFPGLWTNQTENGEQLDFRGHATYAFKVVLRPDQANAEWGLYIQDMYSAYRLFVNGDEVASNGKVSAKQEDYVPYWLPLFRDFEAHSDTLNFVLHVANFHHSKGGISDVIRFGNKDLIETKFRNDQTYDYVLAASLLMGGLFFLGLFFFGREGRTLLYFSLFCFLFSYRVIGSVDYGLHYLFPDLSWYLSIHLEYLNIFGIALVSIKYTRHLYPEETHKFVINPLVGLSMLLLAGVLICPIHIFTQFPPFFVLFILLFIPYSLYVYIKAVIHNRPGAWFSLLSLVFMFITYGLDAVDFFGVGPAQNLLFFIGMVLFFFMQSLVLTYRFAISYKTAVIRAEEAATAKSDFLSVMSHEIRTPLNAVVGMSNLIESGKSMPEEVNTLKHAAQSLLVLVNNILDYTKIDSGKIEFEYLEVQMRDLVDKLVMIHKPEAESSDIELFIHIDDAVPCFVLCDPTRLTQVLSNLLSNGLKFTHEGSVSLNVLVVNEQNGKVTLRFEVSDTGIGIPLQKQQMIFDEFTQASQSVSRNYGGSGLGLPIISKLLKMQNSHLYLKSGEGQGSTFWFDLTFDKGDGSQQELLQPAQPKNQRLIKGKRILLVEDNPVNVVVARKFLSRWGVEVFVAENGEEALSNQEEVDLILMDLQMPDIDGYALTKMLRERGVVIPILAFTASALNDAKKRILEAGMNDYIMKPFDPDELYKKLVIYLTQPSLSKTSAPKAR